MNPQPKIVALIADALPTTQVDANHDKMIAAQVMGSQGIRRAAWAVFNGSERAQIIRAARATKGRESPRPS